MVTGSIDNNVIEDTFEEGNIERINNIIHRREFSEYLVENGHNLVAIISKHLTKENWESDHAGFSLLIEVLHNVARISNEAATFIELLEQLDGEDVFYEKFLVLLGPIKVILEKLSSRRGCYLEWSLGVIRSFIDKLPIAPEYADENIDVLACDIETKRICYVYKELMLFLDAFIDNLISEKEAKAVLFFSIYILGKPVVYADLQRSAELKNICYKLVSYITNYIPNIIDLVDHLDEKTLVKYQETYMPKFVASDADKTNLRDICDTMCSDESDEECIYDVRNVPDLCLSFLYYLLFENEYSSYIPAIYNKLYIINKVLYLCVVLMDTNHNITILKGLLLCEKIFKELPDNSISHYYLELKVHQEYLRLLSYVTIYSNSPDIRNCGPKLMTQYIAKFDDKGKYFLFLHFLPLTKDNPYLNGYINRQIKNFFLVMYQENRLCEYYKGKRFADLLYYFCYMHNDSKTDLVQERGKIIDAINMMYLVYGIDFDNETGIWDYLYKFKRDIFNPLKNIVTSSKAHYAKRIKQLKFETEALNKSVEIGDAVAVTTPDGTVIPSPSNAEEVESTEAGFNILDLISFSLNMLFDKIRSREEYINNNNV